MFELGTVTRFFSLHKLTSLATLLATILAIVVSAQTITCARFGQFCAVDKVPTASSSGGQVAHNNTPSVALRDQGAVISMLRERTLFTCRTLAFVSNSDKRPDNDTEIAKIHHCNDFGFNTSYVFGTFDDLFGRSATGTFVYDFQVLSKPGSLGVNNLGLLRLFFIHDSKLVAKDLRLECRLFAQNNTYILIEPKIGNVEYSYEKRELRFKNINSLCDALLINDDPVLTSAPDRRYIHIPWITVTLSSDFYPTAAASSMERKD